VKKKILCLHGYAMNPEWLREWLQPIEAMLSPRLEFVYPRGPIACPVDEVETMMNRFQVTVPESRLGHDQNWCWYRATDDKPPRYIGLDETLAGLHKLSLRHDGFDGVLGWSQGAVVAAIMAAQQCNQDAYDYGLMWAVICGGFLPGDKTIKSWFDNEIGIQSLHVVGKKESEFLSQRAVDLYSRFSNADWLETPVGHVMPIKHKSYMSEIEDWIERRL